MRQAGLEVDINGVFSKMHEK
jgi:hypothetical protein